MTQLLQSIRTGDEAAREELVLRPCGELRTLAAARLRVERPGQTRLDLCPGVALRADDGVRLLSVGGEADRPLTLSTRLQPCYSWRDQVDDRLKAGRRSSRHGSGR